MAQIIEALLDFQLTPSEMIDVTRTVTQVDDETGSEFVTKQNVGSYKTIFLPPDTLNKNDGIVLQQLMEGNKNKEIYMLYCYAPDVKAGDTVYRRENGMYYEVKIAAFYGSKVKIVPISCSKIYVVLKDNQKD